VERGEGKGGNRKKRREGIQGREKARKTGTDSGTALKKGAKRKRTIDVLLGRDVSHVWLRRRNSRIRHVLRAKQQKKLKKEDQGLPRSLGLIREKQYGTVF